ncbi:hypothetical protein A7C99_3158 [Trichophyton rubrum]|uniref:Uncharacterized protein n=1 Tax=Trichophyton rubrum TaxID=5551 RepID=A0A178F1P3_TRIRU|nr:hypothetical protein A7C99_3158 [Trichophyton rubrum]
MFFFGWWFLADAPGGGGRTDPGKTTAADLEAETTGRGSETTRAKRTGGRGPHFTVESSVWQRVASAGVRRWPSSFGVGVIGGRQGRDADGGSVQVNHGTAAKAEPRASVRPDRQRQQAETLPGAAETAAAGRLGAAEDAGSRLRVGRQSLSTAQGGEGDRHSETAMILYSNSIYSVIKGFYYVYLSVEKAGFSLSVLLRPCIRPLLSLYSYTNMGWMAV